MTNIGVVNHQFLTLPLKRNVSVFALIVQKRSPLDRRLPSFLFHMGNSCFYKAHSVYHPIPVFDIINFGHRSSILIMCTSFFTLAGYFLVPFDSHHVISFGYQVVQIHTGIQ